MKIKDKKISIPVDVLNRAFRSENRAIFYTAMNKIATKKELYYKAYERQIDRYKGGDDPRERLLTDLIQITCEQHGITRTELKHALDADDEAFLIRLKKKKIEVPSQLLDVYLQVCNPKVIRSLLSMASDIKDMPRKTYVKGEAGCYALALLLVRYATCSNQLDELSENIRNPSNIIRANSKVKKLKKIVI